MTEREAMYFIEGVLAGMTAAAQEQGKQLCAVVAKAHGLHPSDPQWQAIRVELTRWLDEVEDTQ